MPQLGEAVTEGTIIRWLKSEGEFVTQDEPLFEVSTDKVDSEVPSPASGVIEKIVFPEGETVDVGTIVAVIGNQDSIIPETHLPERDLTSMVGMRDLAAITASLGVAAHLDQVSLVPDPIADQKPLVEAATKSSAPTDMGQTETSVPAESTTSISPSDSLVDFYPPSTEDSYLPLADQQYQMDETGASFESERYASFHPDAYLTDIDNVGQEVSVPVESVPVESVPVESVPVESVPVESVSKSLGETQNHTTEGVPLLLSPLVRHLAEENNLDLSSLRATGLGGVITREDVLAHLDGQKQAETGPQTNPHVC